jgi:peroxiredoxin
MGWFRASDCFESGIACPVFPYVEPTVTACLLVRTVAFLQARFAALALGCVLALGGVSATAVEKYELLGQPAPDLVARGLSGENVRLSEHRGEIVVVSFWSGACNTCRAQLEALDRIAKTYGTAGLTVIGVNLDDNAPRAEKFARAQEVQFQLLVATAKSTGHDFRVDRLPMFVVVDREGVLRAAHREFKSSDEARYVRELRKLLDE